VPFDPLDGEPVHRSTASASTTRTPRPCGSTLIGFAIELGERIGEIYRQPRDAFDAGGKHLDVAGSSPRAPGEKRPGAQLTQHLYASPAPIGGSRNATSFSTST
jgi:hypothetical protein